MVKPTAIRFLLYWMGRQPEEINSELDYGVMDALVRRKVAEWHEPQTDKPLRRKHEHRPTVYS